VKLQRKLVRPPPARPSFPSSSVPLSASRKRSQPNGMIDAVNGAHVYIVGRRAEKLDETKADAEKSGDLKGSITSYVLLPSFYLFGFTEPNMGLVGMLV
jgi:hypothetical protein